MVMSPDSPLIYAFFTLLIAVFVVSWLRPSKHSLPHIPAVGPSAPLLSYYGAFKLLFKCQNMLQEGYDKYRGSAFKVAQFSHWHVVITSPTLIEELYKAHNDELSLLDAVIETLQSDYTISHEIFRDAYHIPIIRTQLTRSLSVLFEDIRDELCASFNDAIPLTDEWTKVKALPAIMRVVCRTSNRIFVGLPLCRNSDYINLNTQFTIEVVKASLILKLFPRFLRKFVAYFISSTPSSIARGVTHLKPLIEERYRKMAEFGDDWDEKPNDLLMWLIEVAQGQEREIVPLVIRILTMNFAGIHTSSLSFAHALYHLAANPEYLVDLRDEVETIVGKEGWTKASLRKMRKVDSFLRESQRYNSLGLVSTTRLAQKDFRFSDGTFIPSGTYVSVATMPIHRDAGIYDDADVFNPWRFADMRNEEGEGFKHQMVTTSIEYMPFGHGKHACPGRFFAANELKGMLAHLVVTYDIKFEKEGIMPKPLQLEIQHIPDPRVEIMFRKRAT